MNTTQSTDSASSGLRRQRLFVIAQGLIGAVMLWLAFRYGASHAPHLPDDAPATRLAFAVHWLTVPAALLFISVMITANTRFVNADGFAGTRLPTSRFLEISLRATQNTLEQVVLAACCWLGLAVALPPQRLGLIPVCAGLFAAGRVLFWIGYQIAPPARALGFVLTFVPTAVGLIWLLLRLL